MSETNYTPGPWRVSKTGRSVLAGGVKINQSSGPCAASVAVQNSIDAQLRANANLIAASPDMFRIIQRLATADWIGEAELNLWRKECREIISKVV
jgi:hypothetical protein